MDLIFSFLGLYIVLKLTDRWHRAKGYRGPESDHFNGKIFFSYGTPASAKATAIGQRKPILKWLLHRKGNSWFWQDNKQNGKPEERIMGAELIVTYVNHSTMLIQTEGLNILTDPIWTKRASPFRAVGPARFRDPGVRFEDMPPIDAVLISHNHYDHMDLETLTRVHKKWNPPIIVPLGNEQYLKARHIKNVHDMDWWDAREISKDVKIVCAPGQHFSSRTLSDRNNTLWAGYVIETPHGNIYFAGDTGYGEFVSRIKERYKTFRLAFLPIGAFRPQWFMGPVHISPDQAVQIHHELNVQTSVGMHFGTFHLADDGQDEPQARISELLAEAAGVKPDFRVLENGESTTIAYGDKS